MLKKDVEKIIQEWKTQKAIRLYTPYKYFKGLDTKSLVIAKLQEMQKWKKEQDVHKIQFKTDKSVKTVKKSKYHEAFQKQYGILSSSSLEEKSKVSGVPLSILKTVFSKGVAAWKTGHRPGATAIQWGNARVSSFLVLGCTVFSGDASLLYQVYERYLSKKSAKLKKFFAQKPNCPQYKLERYKKKSNYPSFLQNA